MLHPFIIEQIKRREQEEKRRRQQPAIQLPLPDRRMPRVPRRRPREDDEEHDRGVLIIEL